MELDGDISLYHPDTGQALVLNATASDIWRLLDGEHDLPQIVELLATAYGTQADDIRADVLRVVEDLTHHGFLP
jgi:pyruvate dehydrogenase complex dehydrogenase (E1) component